MKKCCSRIYIIYSHQKSLKCIKKPKNEREFKINPIDKAHFLLQDVSRTSKQRHLLEVPEDKLQYSTNRWNEWLWRRFPHSEGWVPEEFVNWGFGPSFALILNLFLWWDTWCYIFKTLVQDQHKKTTTLGPLARTKKYTCSSACIRLADKSRSLRPPGALASRSDISCSVPHSAVALPRDAARLNETRTLYKFPIKISIIHFHAIFFSFFFPGVHIGEREKPRAHSLRE